MAKIKRGVGLILALSFVFVSGATTLAQQSAYTPKDFSFRGAEDQLNLLRWELRHVKSTLDLTATGTDFLVYDYVLFRDGKDAFRFPIALPKEWVLNQIRSLTYTGQLDAESAAALSNYYVEKTAENIQRLSARYQSLRTQISELEAGDEAEEEWGD